MRNAAKLEAQIRALLDSEQRRDDPLYLALEQLYRRYCDQREQIERLSWISDRYQAAMLQENRVLNARSEQQQRRLQKIARISDRYQEMQRELTRDLRTSATHDPLTGLPNRRLMLEQLQAAGQRRDTDFSLALLDVDHFKQINDAYGHDIGDQVLTRIAALLRSQLRSHDVCARWGGEEFLMLWPDLELSRAIEVAERIRLTMARTPFEIQGVQRTLTISIGVAGYRPDVDQDSADIIKRADFALYAAKRAGRNRTIAERSADDDLADRERTEI
ncbi:diguanylate cyclase [Solimonas marina]|uniref:diguanylate cyclase n=1 Tax=Solimonas marina TaxID=2714601 RepID=A0A970B9J4_9GAMM|nr:diguanylate cyclase [Solimonas marina]NKF22446.1 GGDEF domain-containing protein [Solimonas marina]